MKKVKNSFNFKILLTVVATILMIGTSFSPIISSIQTNTNHNILKQNKKIIVSKEKSL